MTESRLSALPGLRFSVFSPRVSTLDGEVLGTRELTHPHVGEQPFTRSLGGVEMTAPQTVVVAARDSVSGYCGETVEVDVG